MTHKLVNFPQPLSSADYQECCDLIVKEAATKPNVKSVYLMGGEWVPGISDLDIVVVYGDNKNEPPLSSPWKLSDKAAFIFTHRYLSFTLANAKYFYYLYPKSSSNLRLIYGQDIGFEDPMAALGEEDKKMLQAGMLFDLLINKLLLFPRFKQNENLNIRQVIGELYSLAYTFDMLESITGHRIGTEFIAKMRDLRANWFTRTMNLNISDLSSAVDESIGLIVKTVEGLDAYLSGRGCASGYFRFVNPRFDVQSSPGWTDADYLRRFKSKLKLLHREHFRLIVPESFQIFLKAYAESDGEFSKNFVRNTRFASTEETASVPSILKKRAEIVNRAYKDTLESNGMYKIPFTFGFNTSQPNLKRKALDPLVCAFARYLN